MKRVITSLLFFTTFSLADTPNLFINEFLASNASTNLDPDFFSFCDWFEIYNSEDTVVNIDGYYITDDLSDPFKFQFSDSSIIQPNSYFIVWADDIDLVVTSTHANFKLKKSGEEIGLFNLNGDLIDSIIFDQQITDVSYGRQPDGNTQWVYFNEPTPLGPNIAIGYQDIIRSSPPEYLLPGGFYNTSQSIEIYSEELSATIFFTLDGTKPTINSNIYTSPINIDSTTVIRAQVFGNSILPSKVTTNSYFINETFTLPVISITTDPDYLWDDEIGIYVMGLDASPEFPYLGANFWEDWERPIHVELFEINGNLGFSVNAGVKIFGHWSRGYAQKSLKIYARSVYGMSQINYQIFPEKEIDSFEAIVLRNSGVDWCCGANWGSNILFRDGMMTSLVKDTGLDLQAYKPAVVFINGEYWGILNIREKVNEHFLADNNVGVDPDELDLLELAGDPQPVIIEGDNQDYLDMINFVSNNSLADVGNYQIVEEQMDIDNFIDYNISEIYFGNHDWPRANVKFWRSHTDNGRWRWILFDIDMGFGLSRDVNFNTLLHALNDNNNPDSPLWATLLLRRLMENEQFQNRFINRFCFYLSSLFREDYVINHISNTAGNIAPEMPNHISRWGGNLNEWYQNVSGILEYGSERGDTVFNHIASYFGFNESSNLYVSAVPSDAGTISIAGLTIPENSLFAEYFNDIPIRISAIPNEGYQFVNWQGISGENSDSSSIFLILTSDSTITAVFEPTVSVVDEFFIPTEYSFYQNYPNPFNPNTTLRYDLPEQSIVNITIYDMLGRQVKLLINQTQEAGYKSVIWDATNNQGNPVSAGVYLFQIQAGEFVQTKKMVLLK